MPAPFRENGHSRASNRDILMFSGAYLTTDIQNMLTKNLFEGEEYKKYNGNLYINIEHGNDVKNNIYEYFIYIKENPICTGMPDLIHRGNIAKEFAGEYHKDEIGTRTIIRYHARPCSPEEDWRAKGIADINNMQQNTSHQNLQGNQTNNNNQENNRRGLPEHNSSRNEGYSACEGVSSVPVTECEALVDLYSKTDGNQWAVNTNWLKNNDPSTWSGIGVRNGHIYYIALPNNNLNGSLPISINKMRNLVYFNIKNNSIRKPVPQYKRFMPNLQYFFY